MKKLVLMATAFITAIMDMRTQFGNAKSLIANAGARTILGDVVPLDVTGMNLGITCTPVFCNILITEDVAAAVGAANITFKFESDSTADLATSPTVHFATAAIAKGNLTKGTIVASFPLPLGTYKKYLGVTFTPDTNNITAGKATAFLSLDPPQGWKAYDDAI